VNIAVFDLETNGMAGSSVLSASSIVFDGEGAILDIFNRFYLPRERFDPYTARIHGLTPGRLLALRERVPSSPYFLEDWSGLADFWAAWDVAGIAVHNLSFDTSFLPEIAQGAFLWWCSMRGLTDYCAIPKRPGNARRNGRTFKWPKLGEAASIVCDGPASLPPAAAAERIENAMGGGAPHVSLFDCFELYRVVSRVARHRADLLRFAPFAAPFRPSGARPAALAAAPAPDRFTEAVLRYERRLRSLLP
jgi:hypothetical protein